MCVCVCQHEDAHAHVFVYTLVCVLACVIFVLVFQDVALRILALLNMPDALVSSCCAHERGP